MSKNEIAIPWEEAWEQICAEQEEKMRPFKELTWRKKLRRIWFTLADFIRYRIIGTAFGGGIRELWYWLRCHLWNRYHVLNLSKYSPDYKWGYLDRDRAMFLACFHCLVEYVEEEAPFETIDWDWDADHAKIGQEIKDLYKWWRFDRKKEHAAVEALLEKTPRREWRAGHLAWDDWVAQHNALEDKDDAQLERLLKIRKYLWT